MPTLTMSKDTYITSHNNFDEVCSKLDEVIALLRNDEVQCSTTLESDAEEAMIQVKAYIIQIKEAKTQKEKSYCLKMQHKVVTDFQKKYLSKIHMPTTKSAKKRARKSVYGGTT